MISRHLPPPGTRQFITENLRLLPVPSVPEIRLYTAHPASGLRRLAGSSAGGPPPYWAYAWAGGAVLARYILDRPETVAGRCVLDLGAGSGLVGIAAAKAGASRVIAADIDCHALAAIELNAAANGVAVAVTGEDLTAGPPPPVDLVAAGDVYYDRDVAERVTVFLDSCLSIGIDVLVGDPGRVFLPRPRLRLLAEYTVPDFGSGKGAATGPSAVYALERQVGTARQS